MKDRDEERDEHRCTCGSKRSSSVAALLVKGVEGCGLVDIYIFILWAFESCPSHGLCSHTELPSRSNPSLLEHNPLLVAYHLRTGFTSLTTTSGTVCTYVRTCLINRLAWQNGGAKWCMYMTSLALCTLPIRFTGISLYYRVKHCLIRQSFIGTLLSTF